MLNKYKKIKLETCSSKQDSFWNTPFPPSSRFQTLLNSKILDGLPVILGQQQLPQKNWWKKKRKRVKTLKFHFFFSGFVFNSIFLFKKFSRYKNRNFGKFNLKKRVFLMHKLFYTKKTYKGYCFKPKKGGYITSALGFRSFIPKSHSTRLFINPTPIKRVMGLKVTQRRKRFLVHKKRILVNIISSSNPPKISSSFKDNKNLGDKVHYLQKVTIAVNQRIQKERTK